MPRRTIVPIVPFDPRRAVSSLALGGGDPTVVVDDAAWIAFHTSSGPATLRVEPTGDGIEAQAWGPGAGDALEVAPDLIGANDDPREFATDHPIVGRLQRRSPDLRVTRSGLVTHALIRAVFGQKVTGAESKRSHRLMSMALGEPAPGPRRGLLLPPEPSVIAALSYEDFHPWGVERKRADTILEVARRSRRLEEAASMPLPDAYRRLQAVRGVGPWSAALVGMQALGDADAVPVGDYNIPNTVAWLLAGEPRADDDRMLELLEPFRPHRGRVVRLLKASGTKPPRYGPRLPLRNIERM